MKEISNPLQKLMQEKFTERQIRNPAYSLRAFARSLGKNPGLISMILNGKRKVSLSKALQIAGSLGLDPEQRLELSRAYVGASVNNEEKTPGPSTQSVLLQADTFRLISDWYHFAILSLTEVDDFHSEASWVAKRLGISKSVAANAIDRMLRLGLIEEDQDGQLKATNQSLTTTSDVRNLSLRKAHSKNLEMAQRSLEKDAIELRDFSAVTMAIDTKLLPEAKKRILSFRQELAELLESGSKKEVYKMCIQLFPLTQKQGDPS